MTEDQKNKFRRMCDGLGKAEAQHNLSNYNNMCNWLKSDHYLFYLQVKNNLIELWEELQLFIKEFLGGVTIGVAAVLGTPIVGIVEGVEEGLKNGLEAGVKKGFKAMGDFLDDVFS